MDLAKELDSFISDLNSDLTIGNNHLLNDLPFKFTAPDFLYFFSLKDRFWAKIKESDKRLTVSLAMTELYLSALLHIYSSEYQFNEASHHLEDSVLYGDLLSGAFAEKLIAIGEAKMLKEALELLQKIHQDLVAFSLEGKSIIEKKACLIQYIIEEITTDDERMFYLEMANDLLLHHNLPKALEDILPEVLQNAMDKVVTSSGDLIALKGE